MSSTKTAIITGAGTGIGAALLPEDVAAAVCMVANLPARAIVEEITIFPRQVVSQ
ncbi:MAG: hypothetical protein O7G87_19095 [bacterium]|nr:hypothetical protein [bacterium]